MTLIDFHTGEDRLPEVRAAKAAARRRAVRIQRENEFELTSRPHESRRASFRERFPTQVPRRAGHRLAHLVELLREVRHREACPEDRFCQCRNKPVSRVHFITSVLGDSELPRFDLGPGRNLRRAAR